MSTKTLGRFEVSSMLGRGAMGCVYLAYDPRIDRRVAIKTLEGLEALPAQEREMTRARFLREAQAAGRLSHPNIVTIFDVGEEGGTPYIAMEFLDGVSLEAHTSAPKLLPTSEVLSLMDQAGSALQYAHASGIVHRDIKPANLMLLPGGILKIADFGLAKRPEANLTTEGILVGTPYYMSPEQIRGAALDGRSDLFSLGVVFYQLLTGTLPFPGESIHTVIHRILSEPPAEFEDSSRLPPELRHLVRRAIEKDAALRPATGEEFRRELRNAAKTAGLVEGALALRLQEADERASGPEGAATVRLGGASSPAPPRVRPGPPARPARPAPVPRRGRKLLGIATVLATLLVAAGAVYLFVLGRGTGARSLSQAVPAAEHLPAELADAGPTIRIRTDPAAKLFLDGKPLAGPTFRLRAGDAAKHRLRAEAGCRAAEKEFAGGASPAEIELAVAPERVRLPVASTPPAARVTVNGAALDGRTPLTIEVDRCAENRVELSHEGFKPVEYRLGAGAEVAPLAAALGSVVFQNQEPGTLKVDKGPYEGSVFIDGRLMGTAGGAFSVPAGRRRVALVSDPLFVRVEEQISIGPGTQIVWKPVWPSLGSLTVQATPTNCSIEVRSRNESAFRYVDDVPVLRYRLAAGSYTIRCTLRTSGQAQQRDIEILPGANVQIDFTFS